MTVTVTSRHFKAHQTLVEYAEAAVQGLSRYYDGIIKCEVILSYEKKRKSTKIAEIVCSVYRHRITSEGRTEDFEKSIDAAADRVLIQLKKVKDRLHQRDRKAVRRVREKV
ncbi:MAG TPA: ribosome-associated translation inhibitor RaiA [Bacteroidota bacterium]|nr:ribosome-associated translation inhibitor RaiA [Bacteroidota bacterium]